MRQKSYDDIEIRAPKITGLAALQIAEDLAIYDRNIVLFWMH
jgi:hypothetical protein